MNIFSGLQNNTYISKYLLDIVVKTMESQEDEELKQRMRNQVRDGNEVFGVHQKSRKVATQILKALSILKPYNFLIILT